MLILFHLQALKFESGRAPMGELQLELIAHATG